MLWDGINMIPNQLKPNLELLREEYVLVQAWKKTASYIRHHNWFSDTLALDEAAVNLPEFIDELRKRLKNPEWENDPLRIVPAPKNQRWKVQEDGKWEPEKENEGPEKENEEPEKENESIRLRPLAHVSLADQVVATALMLCLADRVETQQGDPRKSIRDEESRKQGISYGNRLFCDDIGGELHHRWGSDKLYRSYYQDYRTFLSRPEVAAEPILKKGRNRVYVVHADLLKFYDRVRPELFFAAISQLQRNGDDKAFFSLAESLFKWRWHPRDKETVRIYAKRAEIKDFEWIALPQGLVASGFFANVVLLPFDDALRKKIGTEVIKGVTLIDVCRYVDDMQIVIDASNLSGSPENGIKKEAEKAVTGWLNEMLKEHADGLKLSPDKTKTAPLGGSETPLVRQRVKMDRVQSAVSGGFDALGGGKILDAIQGLMRAQETFDASAENSWKFSPVFDVRNETVARFGAGRYRATYRSIRPLLQDDETSEDLKAGRSDLPLAGRSHATRTRHELDEDTKAFALNLIQRWINDPSNVRLLRIGLDLWPDVELLRGILSLLRPFTEEGGYRKREHRQVAWYCFSEVLRAGATETGFVEDNESLPSGVDLSSYRKELRNEAVRLVSLPTKTIPWYLRQQALLFLATSDPAEVPVGPRPELETRLHWRIVHFLHGDRDRFRGSSEFATLAVLSRCSFANQAQATSLILPHLNKSRIRQIARRNPSFLLELIKANSLLINDLPTNIRENLLISENFDRDPNTLASLVLSGHPNNSLRNELFLLRFATDFLNCWLAQKESPEVITPWQVTLEREGGEREEKVAEIKDLRIKNKAAPSGSVYEVPEWCEKEERWRFQLGFLLRFILSGQQDFTRFVRRQPSWKETMETYRPAESHWYQRKYGLYSGQKAFGDDWLPITDWAEEFLLALLRWPGCRVPERFDWVEKGIEAARTEIRRRITKLEELRGSATRALILPLSAKQPTTTEEKRPLRIGVVQTALPTDNDFKHDDLPLDGKEIRRKHRNHLSAALEAVKRMLKLRETHKGSDGRLDWLILPELAVHPKDVRTHLEPFARAYKTIILTGLTYERVLENRPLVNSALWIIPEHSDTHGLQIRTHRQGKKHLAPDELNFNRGRSDALQGFRPCQWLVGYPWSNANSSQPVWVTAAVCYDATDLGLISDLRDKSDILAIPSLNKDVKTFDQMAMALHYHIFQLVIVANNGQYGGSNAYWPMKEDYKKQIFHIHGQPQASVAFLEIDDISSFLERRCLAKKEKWKYPPAGLGVCNNKPHEK